MREHRSLGSKSLELSDRNNASPPEDAEKPDTLLLVGSQVQELSILLSAMQDAGIKVVAARIDRLPALKPSGMFDIALVSSSDPDANLHQMLQLIKSRFNIPLLCLVPVPSGERIANVCQWPVDDLAFMPVRIDEIQARIALLLRKSKQRATLTYPFIERRRSMVNVNGVEHSEVAAVPKAPFRIDDRAKTVMIGSETIHLTPKEYQLLALLVSDPGRVFSVKDILRHLWPNKNAREPDAHQYIYLLRKKIEKDPSAPKWILTEQGFGYMFQVTPL